MKWNLKTKVRSWKNVGEDWCVAWNQNKKMSKELQEIFYRGLASSVTSEKKNFPGKFSVARREGESKNFGVKWWMAWNKMKMSNDQEKNKIQQKNLRKSEKEILPFD